MGEYRCDANCRLAGHDKPCTRWRSGCLEGSFRYKVSKLARYGKWTIRQRAAHGTSAPMCATLKGSKGTVELWGGNHAQEVWFIGNQGEEHQMLGGSLTDMIERACSMAGIQQRLAL